MHRSILKEPKNNNEVTNMRFYNDTTINSENYTGKVHEVIDTKNIECGDMYPIARKKTMYISADGSMCVFMLRSKFHADQGYWRIDINHTQKDEMQNHKGGIFFFCLDEHGIIQIDFSDIKPFLTEKNAVKGTRKHGGSHWQLRFSDREIVLKECRISCR